MLRGSALRAPRTVSVDSFLVSVDSRLVSVDSRLVSVDSRLVSVDSRLVSVDSRLVSVDSRLVSVDSRLVTRDSETTDGSSARGNRDDERASISSPNVTRDEPGASFAPFRVSGDEAPSLRSFRSRLARRAARIRTRGGYDPTTKLGLRRPTLVYLDQTRGAPHAQRDSLLKCARYVSPYLPAGVPA